MSLHKFNYDTASKGVGDYGLITLSLMSRRRQASSSLLRSRHALLPTTMKWSFALDTATFISS